MLPFAELFAEGSRARTIAVELERLIPVPPLLAGGAVDAELGRQLVNLSGTDLLDPKTIGDPEMAEAVRSGLLLWNGSFEESHEIAQGIDSPTGAYWHGLCHRREGRRGSGLEYNFSNAGYWFRRVGDHPVYADLYDRAIAILESDRDAGAKRKQLGSRGQWDPFLYIDWCLACESTQDKASRPTLEAIQAEEMNRLLSYCVREAC